jgi:hypothetical protein
MAWMSFFSRNALLSCLSIIPDLLALHFILLPPTIVNLTTGQKVEVPGSNGARILLLTSWTWVMLRNSHFRINRVSSESDAITEQQQWLHRTLYKLGLFAISYFFTALDGFLSQVLFEDPDVILIGANSTITQRSKMFFTESISPLHRFKRFRFEAAVALTVNHIIWEMIEDHLLKNKDKKTDSISKFLANSTNKRFKHLLTFYLCIFTLIILWCESVMWGLIFIIGWTIVIFVKTESSIKDGDEMQTGVHCVGMIVVILVAICITTTKTDVFWINKFSSIFPYFFMFISSISSHTSLKMRAEIKMFKHLCDIIVVVFAYGK